MSGNDIDAEIRAVLLDLVLLRKPFDEAAEAVVPYVLRHHRGAPLVLLDRAAMRNAIGACRSGAVSTRELRHWALVVHMELTAPPGPLARDSLLGWESRARRILHHHLHRLMEAGENGVTDELLDQIDADLNHTDWTWIARKPWAAPFVEIAAIAAWTFLAAKLLVPHLPDSPMSASLGTFGAMTVSLTVVRLVQGADAAIERFQTYLPAALLAAAVLGATFALGGTQ
ncbi:hypothetical protein [Glycomyces sp. NPDC048151]|uniref:hypothetical protein n=1 Tax=Glycomyces sp. NPDC048151 TaxID=3364002 RepID=UPI003717F0CC